MQSPKDEDFEAIQRMIVSSDVACFEKLRQIHAMSRDFGSFAHEHDVNEKFPMNGYRSMITITDTYFSMVRRGMETRSPDLLNYRSAAATIVSLMELMLKMHNQGNDDEDSLAAFMDLLRFQETDVEPFHSDIRGFYLRPGLRSIMNGLLMRVILTNISFTNLFRVFRGSQSRLFTRLSLNGRMEEIRHLWGPAEFGVIRWIHWVKFSFAPGTLDIIPCPRQSQYIVMKDGSISIGDADKEQVSCAYLTHKAKGESPSDSLIFHCPGGGYLSSTYKSHEVYLREWGRKLQVPIICTSYRLSPEHPYPASLQDLLDAYLFFTSGSPDSVEKLGFRPKNVIVTGDSAGGNLALALILALNEIRKRGLDVLMPVSIALQYPNANPAVEKSAARAMSVIDTTITLSGLGHAAASYFGIKDSGEKPWFRSEDVITISRRMMEKMKSDQLYNPLISNNYSDLKGIKLFITGAEFDPLLDDSVAIGRVWQGPLVMDLAKGLPHSFMSYAAVPDVTDALELIISRVAEGLNIAYQKN